MTSPHATQLEALGATEDQKSRSQFGILLLILGVIPFALLFYYLFIVLWYDLPQQIRDARQGFEENHVPVVHFPRAMRFLARVKRVFVRGGAGQVVPEVPGDVPEQDPDEANGAPTESTVQPENEQVAQNTELDDLRRVLGETTVAKDDALRQIADLAATKEKLADALATKDKELLDTQATNDELAGALATKDRELVDSRATKDELADALAMKDKEHKALTEQLAVNEKDLAMTSAERDLVVQGKEELASKMKKVTDRLALIAAEKEELARQLELAKEELQLARTKGASLVAEGDGGASESPGMGEEPTHGNWVIE